MGKKRIITEGEAAAEVKKPKTEKKVVAETATEAKKPIEQAKSKKKSVGAGTLYVQSTYNNTKVLLTDKSGNALAASSAGALGFRGAKKGTPFAAAKVGELLGDKAIELSMKEVDVVVSGVGSGRESAIRGFISRSIGLSTIKDVTPVPHNGPKAKKPRRV